MGTEFETQTENGHVKYMVRMMTKFLWVTTKKEEICREKNMLLSRVQKSTYLDLLVNRYNYISSTTGRGLAWL